ncbi:MAG: prolyl oligopeptidase family serine peptidase [Candidatus Omnitrophica bacterium]|nr:prolyl oligopeptidase family serine peptidase [Candidatus Omnitrophota bacterium]
MPQPLFLLPHEWNSYYTYSKHLPAHSAIPLKSNRHYQVKKICLRYPTAAETEANREFNVYLYESSLAGRLPTILINPIFRGTRIARVFAQYFARRGFNAAVVEHDPFTYDTSRDFDQIEHYLKNAVIRDLKVLDWIVQHEKTDSQRIGTFGISFGAIIGSVVAALDARPKCHVLALAGAPVSGIISRTRHRRILKLVRHTARKREKSPRDLAWDILRHIKTEPLFFAKHVKTENVAMYISLFDRVVRPVYARRLWRALGKPKAFFVPFGHYTSIISYPYAGRLAYRFYKEKLVSAN